MGFECISFMLEKGKFENVNAFEAFGLSFKVSNAHTCFLYSPATLRFPAYTQEESFSVSVQTWTTE